MQTFIICCCIFVVELSHSLALNRVERRLRLWDRRKEHPNENPKES